MRRTRSRNALVRFFRVVIDGERTPNLPLDIQATHVKLNALAFDQNARPSRYYTSADNELFVGWSSLGLNNLRLLVARELPDAPSYEEQGAFRVAQLGASGRWVAPTYCVVFPNKSIAGAIYSQEGPRMGQVSRYLEDENAVNCGCKIEFEALAKQDVEADLRRLRSIRKIQLQYHPSTTPTLFHGQHEDLDSAMAAFINMREAATVTITIDAGRNAMAGLTGLKDRLMGLIRRGPLLGVATKFVVTGPDQYTNRNVPVDLLTQLFVAPKSVELAPGAKNLDETSAYRAIEEAYAERLTQFPSVQIISDT